MTNENVTQEAVAEPNALPEKKKNSVVYEVSQGVSYVILSVLGMGFSPFLTGKHLPLARFGTGRFNGAKDAGTRTWCWGSHGHAFQHLDNRGRLNLGHSRIKRRLLRDNGRTTRTNSNPLGSESTGWLTCHDFGPARFRRLCSSFCGNGW